MVITRAVLAASATENLSAVVYPAGRQIVSPRIWRSRRGTCLIRMAPVPGRRYSRPACSRLLDRTSFVFNRLAARPSIQARLRLSVLAYDRPDAVAQQAFTAGRGGSM